MADRGTIVLQSTSLEGNAVISIHGFVPLGMAEAPFSLRVIHKRRTETWLIDTGSIIDSLDETLSDTTIDAPAIGINLVDSWDITCEADGFTFVNPPASEAHVVLEWYEFIVNSAAGAWANLDVTLTCSALTFDNVGPHLLDPGMVLNDTWSNIAALGAPGTDSVTIAFHSFDHIVVTAFASRSSGGFGPIPNTTTVTGAITNFTFS